MTKFSMSSEEASRLSVFSDYVKKMGSVYPLNDKQLFIFDGKTKKLNVYADGKSAVGGAGLLQSSFDIDVISEGDDKTFISEISRISTIVQKLLGDEIVFNFDDKKLSMKQKANKNSFTIALFVNRDQGEIDELTSFISDQMETDEFKNAVILNVKDVYSKACSISGMLRVLPNSAQTIQVALDGSSIKVSDQLCIVDYNSGKKSKIKGNVLIETSLLPMIKDVEELKYSSDKKFIYFNLEKHGIQVIYSPKTPDFSYPNDEDIENISPEKSNICEVVINSKNFYNAIDKFSGLFQSACWKYEEVKVNTTDIDKKKDLYIHFDDMATCVDEYLPLENIVSKCKENNFEWQLPTIYLKYFKDFFLAEENLTLEYNGVDHNKPHGMGVILRNSELKLILAKVEEGA